jgi:hypothetical protein
VIRAALNNLLSTILIGTVAAALSGHSNNENDENFPNKKISSVDHYESSRTGLAIHLRKDDGLEVRKCIFFS